MGPLGPNQDVVCSLGSPPPAYGITGPWRRALKSRYCRDEADGITSHGLPGLGIPPGVLAGGGSPGVLRCDRSWVAGCPVPGAGSSPTVHPFGGARRVLCSMCSDGRFGSWMSHSAIWFGHLILETWASGTPAESQQAVCSPQCQLCAPQHPLLPPPNPHVHGV